MRPSRNAFWGYSYQKMITFLLIAKMDVEREFGSIEIESIVDHNFDDVKIVTKAKTFYCQMKDFDSISLSQIKFSDKKVIINNKEHTLSDQQNVLFIKGIDIVPNTSIFGIPAFSTNGIYIVSLSRDEAWRIIHSLYEQNEPRIYRLEFFFDTMLDQRILVIERKKLPHIEIYSTELIDKTLKLQEIILSDSNIINIIGKPGVGKSHLVNQLELENNHILYRFWISNQDPDYRERLNYKKFLLNLTKELYQNLLHKTEDEIISKIRNDNLALIIDGLDHVENYNVDDLKKYINFIEKVGTSGKVIVLSRPLKRETSWEKRVLGNWNYDQTAKLLDEFYHITEYAQVNEIYRLSDGYPIIVSFIAKHFKQFGIVPKLDVVSDLNEYYSAIIRNASSKSALALFLTSRSYFMMSEVEDILEPYSFVLIKEFITSHPYLFEIRLNRVSLIHDSFNTYLRNQCINLDHLKEKVLSKVSASILSGETRYLSRFNFYDLPTELKKSILKKFANIEQFKLVMTDCIDFEAIVSFYSQLREVISEIEPDFLEIEDYYDLSLIYNIIHRDHTSSINGFFYLYAKALIYNGYSCEAITSSDYLFSFFYFIEENDAELIRKVLSDDNYSIENFYDDLNHDLLEEDNYFRISQNIMPINDEFRSLIGSKMEYQVKDLIEKILVNTYIHGIQDKEFQFLDKAIRIYIDQEDPDNALSIIKKALVIYGVRDFFAKSILKNARNMLESLGYVEKKNDYLICTLSEYIDKYSDCGSFNILKRVTNYIRLSLYRNKKIDISSIGKFWTMYNERKDYSVISLPSAFYAFERLGLITEADSCKLIVNAQKLSEKGIRTILENYIKLHDVSILRIIEKNFILDDLQVDWFELPSNFIDSFSESLFQVAMRRILRFSSSGQIKISDIENALLSNKCDLVLKILSITKHCIEIPENHELIDFVRRLNIIIDLLPIKNNESDYKRSSSQRFNEGVITFEDIDYVNSLELEPYEIAAYTNGYNMLLSDIALYTKYPKEIIQKDVLMILQSAFLGRIKNINMYGYVYYFVGNFPLLFYKNDINVDWNRLYSSLQAFLDLSFIKIDYQ